MYWRRVEQIVNVLLIVCVGIGVAGVLNYLLPSNVPRRATDLSVAPGTQLNGLPDSFLPQKPVLLAVLSPQCGYCTQSIAFYRMLQSERIDVRFVFGETPEVADAYAAAHRLSGPIQGGVDLAALGVRATPTLMLVNEHRAVKKAWVGKLSDHGEAEVRNAVTGNAGRVPWRFGLRRN